MGPSSLTGKRVPSRGTGGLLPYASRWMSVCPSCAAPYPDGARFCPNCGHDLGRTRGEERRVVTVLFADLVGFTGQAERMDPEMVKTLVDGLFQSLVEDVTSFGGRVDKILGDAIVALFGAPVAHEDDAERAVRASLRMQRSIAERVADLELPIRIRIGINTGEVLVGALRAGGDYTAMGDVVNIASRLQTAAPPGGVLVGPATHAATEGAIAYEPIGEVEVRGPRGEGGGLAGHRTDHAARPASPARPGPVRRPRAGALPLGRHRAHRPLPAPSRAGRDRGRRRDRQDPTRRGGPDRAHQAPGRHRARRIVRAVRRSESLVADRQRAGAGPRCRPRVSPAGDAPQPRAPPGRPDRPAVRPGAPRRARQRPAPPLRAAVTPRRHRPLPHASGAHPRRARRAGRTGHERSADHGDRRSPLGQPQGPRAAGGGPRPPRLDAVRAGRHDEARRRAARSTPVGPPDDAGAPARAARSRQRHRAAGRDARRPRHRWARPRAVRPQRRQPALPGGAGRARGLRGPDRPAARLAPRSRRRPPGRAAGRPAGHARQRRRARFVRVVRRVGGVRPGAGPEHRAVAPGRSGRRRAARGRRRVVAVPLGQRPRGRLPHDHQGGSGPPPHRRGQGHDRGRALRLPPRRRRPPLGHGGRAHRRAGRRAPARRSP